MTSTNAEITGQSPTQREIIKVSLRFMHKLKFQRLSANEKLRKLKRLSYDLVKKFTWREKVRSPFHFVFSCQDDNIYGFYDQLIRLSTHST